MVSKKKRSPSLSFHNVAVANWMRWEIVYAVLRVAAKIHPPIATHVLVAESTKWYKQN